MTVAASLQAQNNSPYTHDFDIKASTLGILEVQVLSRTTRSSEEGMSARAHAVHAVIYSPNHGLSVWASSLEPLSVDYVSI